MSDLFFNKYLHWYHTVNYYKNLFDIHELFTMVVHILICMKTTVEFDYFLLECPISQQFVMT